MDSEEDAPLHGHTQTIREDGDKRHNEGRTGDGIQRQWSILPRPQTTNCVSLLSSIYHSGGGLLNSFTPWKTREFGETFLPIVSLFFIVVATKIFANVLKYVVTEEGKQAWHRD